MQRRDEAYVLRTHPLGDADLIVSLFARCSGKVRGVARHARRSRRRFGGSLEPLTFVRVRWAESAGRELQRLLELETLRSYAEMQGEPLRQAACAVISELCEVFAREGEEEPQAFRLVGSVLDALEQGLDPATALRYFEYWTLRLHGLLPSWDCCSECHSTVRGALARLWVGAEGMALCARCAERRHEALPKLGRAGAEFLAAAKEMPPMEMTPFVGVSKPGGALERLLRGTLQTFAEQRFRSYRHLYGSAELVAADNGER